jgi:HSP20 family protein
LTLSTTSANTTAINYMQSLRATTNRIPQQLTRTFTTSPAEMSLFPRFTQEFAPIFRLFDEYDRAAFRNMDSAGTPLRSFTPKFDVKETSDAYELHGEIPGVEHKDVSIEWTDNNTLTISGRHERVREEGRRPESGFLEGPKSRSSQAQLEGHHEADSSKSAPAAATSNANTDVQTTDIDAHPDGPSQPKYWVSERSVGSFHRSFAFPARVDQDAVRASLKNGILSIAVPKAKAQTKRTVTIDSE